MLIYTNLTYNLINKYLQLQITVTVPVNRLFIATLGQQAHKRKVLF